jgi:hypothetical protein
MKSKVRKYNRPWIIIIVVVIVCIFLYVAYYSQEDHESFDTSIKTRTLEKDGFCVFYDPEYSNHLDTNLQTDTLQRLPENYVFIDYVYKINNVALSTFHRDVTSSKYVFYTEHPTYTLILYNYDGELLSVCPGSHATYPFVWSKILNIDGKRGTAFLFDCDLLHAGRVNYCKDRDVVQYKLCHKDDLSKLSSLQGINVEKTEVCIDSFLGKIQRKFSYFFEMPINTIAYPLMMKRETKNSLIGTIQSVLPIDYYNNST